MGPAPSTQLITTHVNKRCLPHLKYSKSNKCVQWKVTVFRLFTNIWKKWNQLRLILRYLTCDFYFLFAFDGWIKLAALLFWKQKAEEARSAPAVAAATVASSCQHSAAYVCSSGSECTHTGAGCRRAWSGRTISDWPVWHRLNSVSRLMKEEKQRGCL